MRQNAVIPSFVRTAIKGGPLTIRGDGEQFRQFTHVSDIAKAFELALAKGNPGPAYNIVASERTSIRSLAERVVSRIPVSVVKSAARPGDAPSLYVDSQLAHRELGWKAEIPLTKGLDELIDSIHGERPDRLPSVTTS